MKKIFLVALFLLCLTSPLYAFDELNRPWFIGDVSVDGNPREDGRSDSSELSLRIPYDGYTFSWENHFSSESNYDTFLKTDYTMFIGSGWFRPEMGIGLVQETTIGYGRIGWTWGWRFHQSGLDARSNSEIGPSNFIDVDYFLLEDASVELLEESKGNFFLGDVFMTGAYRTTGYMEVKAGVDVWLVDRVIQVFVDYNMLFNDVELADEFTGGWTVHVSVFYMGMHFHQESDTIYSLGISF